MLLSEMSKYTPLRMRFDLPLTGSLTSVGSQSTNYITSGDISQTSLSFLEQAIAAAPGSHFGGTGPIGPTGATGALLGAVGPAGAVQFNSNNAGAFGGNSTLLFDGVSTLTLNGATINSSGTGPNNVLKLQGNSLSITPSAVNTLNNTLDDGLGNATFLATATAVNGVFTGTVNANSATVTAGLTTGTLTVNGFPLQKNLQANGQLTASVAGPATLSAPLFAVGSFTVNGGTTLRLPNVSTANNYWITVAGSGTLSATSSGTCTVSCVNTSAAPTVLFGGAATNAFNTAQTVFVETQVFIQVAANTTNASFSVNTTGYTSFVGTYQVQQMF